MTEEKKKRKKSPWWYRLAILIFGAIFCVSAFMAGRDFLEAKKEADAFDSLSRLAAEYAENGTQSSVETKTDGGSETVAEKVAEESSPEVKYAKLPDDPWKAAAGYAALQKVNPDYIGWIQIPDTRLNYPVVFRESDPEYYLHRAFDGSKSYGGTPFLGEMSGVDTKCCIIYGHNMKNGSMFGTLVSYKKAAYRTSHPLIYFYVNGEPRKYEIFAVVETKALSDGEEGFRYHQYDGNISEEEWNELVTWLQSSADYDTGIIPDPQDQILMLSTCSYHVQDGRLVVAARRVAE